jgi:hypothetical protein
VNPPPPGPGDAVGVDIDGSGIDMYPEPAAVMMTDIATILTNARNEWNASNGRILALEGGLGNGPLGRPVAAQYNPTADQIREFIQQMISRLDKVSGAGSRAVPLYVDSDVRAGQHFEF